MTKHSKKKVLKIEKFSFGQNYYNCIKYYQGLEPKKEVGATNNNIRI